MATSSSRSIRHAPVVAALGVGLGIGIAVTSAHLIWAPPPSDLQLLALFLFLSGGVSLILGSLAAYLAQSGVLPSLWLKFTAISGLSTCIVLVNVLLTAYLMFISPHDLGLLLLLLAFSAGLALLFATLVARSLSVSAVRLAVTASRLAGDDLTARAEVRGNDEIAQLARALNVMAERLGDAFSQRRDLERARRDLVVAVSHDLRTPLATIRAMVEALADGVVSDQETVDRYLGAIGSETRRLAGLIDDLFELSQLDTGAVKLQLDTCSVGDLISDTLEGTRALASERGITVCGEIDDSLPMIVGDARKIERVLVNLVQNAIRHTAAGGSVVLEARARNASVDITVADDGEGIAATDLPRVFDRFYRGEKSRSREHGGAGLGLAIARGIVEAHGGQIWVESAVGEGTRFTFSLPVGGDSAAALTSATQPTYH
ncbi:MAG: HAMP domain-containing protein [Chloroflexi bacterium]|nr:HAMP domain-containing protein [Chloroflexota bacterium]